MLYIKKISRDRTYMSMSTYSTKMASHPALTGNYVIYTCSSINFSVYLLNWIFHICFELEMPLIKKISKHRTYMSMSSHVLFDRSSQHSM